jgi:small-conductance mechanosensitive channel
MKIIEVFTDYWNGLVKVLPNIAIGLVFLILGWLLSRLVANSIRRILERFGLEMLAERTGLRKMLNGFGFTMGISKVTSIIVYYMLVMFVLLIAAEQMNITALITAIHALMAYAPKLLTAMLIFLAGALIADRVKDAISTITSSLGISGGKVIAQGLHVIILLIVVVTALNVAGIDTTLLTSNILVIMAAILLAFGIAYGFASKDILRNILSSYYSKGRLKQGMRIRIADDEGVIKRIDSISLVLDCGDKDVLIPTNKLITERVELLR